MEVKKMEFCFFLFLFGELRLNIVNWLYGVMVCEFFFLVFVVSVMSGELLLLVGNCCIMCFGDIIFKLFLSVGVLLFLEGDIYIVVFGMGVIWWEFGDGVFMFERYLRMCMGVLFVLGLFLVIEGLRKVLGLFGGVMLIFVLIVVFFNLGFLLVNMIFKR